MSKIKTVVYLGPMYTFSHEAALIMFPKAEHIFDVNFDKVYEKVESGEIDYGVLPVENSTTGVISETYHHLVDQEYKLNGDGEVDVNIVKELFHPIYHNLLARNDMSLSDIKTLYTHRQPYLQSSNWINSNLPLSDIEVVFTDSTAKAAEMLFQDTSAACIGGNLLAKEKKLVKLNTNIQNFKRNITRFFAISSKHKRIGHSCDKTTVSFILPDRPNALVEALQLVSEQKINLINIKTLPIRAFHLYDRSQKDWFIIDVKLKVLDKKYEELHSSFKNNPELIKPFKILGCYPTGETTGTKKKPTPRSKPPKRYPESDRAHFFIEMIKKGESEDIEFKASLRYDMIKKAVNKELSIVIAKTLCGFMNSNGGYLLIGVADNREIIGIENDIKTLSNKDNDSFLKTLYQIVSNSIGLEYSQYIHPEIIDIEGKDVCCIKVDSCFKAAWLNENNNDIFYLRVGNSTRPLSPKDAHEYLLSRYKTV